MANPETEQRILDLLEQLQKAGASISLAASPSTSVADLKGASKISATTLEELKQTEVAWVNGFVNWSKSW